MGKFKEQKIIHLEQKKCSFSNLFLWLLCVSMCARHFKTFLQRDHLNFIMILSKIVYLNSENVSEIHAKHDIWSEWRWRFAMQMIFSILCLTITTACFVVAQKKKNGIFGGLSTSRNYSFEKLVLINLIHFPIRSIKWAFAMNFNSEKPPHNQKRKFNAHMHIRSDWRLIRCACAFDRKRI